MDALGHVHILNEMTDLVLSISKVLIVRKVHLTTLRNGLASVDSLSNHLFAAAPTDGRFMATNRLGCNGRVITYFQAYINLVMLSLGKQCVWKSG